MDTNSSNSAFNRAKNEISQINSLESALKLHWGWPLACAVLVFLLGALIGAYVAWVIGIGVVFTVLAVWTLFQAKSGKSNPIKLTWLQLGLPGVICIILGVAPPLAMLIGKILLGWFALALLFQLPWKKWFGSAKQAANDLEKPFDETREVH